MDVKVRFAPSPTGPFSLGNARTALFNWLFARNKGGKFLLRIEDTDKERSRKEYEKDILDALKWLGFDYDEKIIRQSERTDIYKKYLQKLLDEKKAYYCFCSQEDLEYEYQSQLSQGITPHYSGKCKSLRDDEIRKKLKTQKGVIRFKMIDTTVSFADMVRGNIEFKTNLFGDIIIAKGIDKPLYNFAVVIDDNEMKITHVIRGEDHLSNTPKQIMIQKALEFSPITYGHLPLILGPDHKKLSKRYLATSINEYRRQGYISEAMFNFLALLGWHPQKDREVISRDEAIKEFKMERVQKSGGIFNEKKLNWLNSYYLKKLSEKDFIEKTKQFIPKGWLSDEKLLFRIVPLVKDRIEKLSDFEKFADMFFAPPQYHKELLPWKDAGISKTKKSLEKVLKTLEKIEEKDFTDKILTTKLNLIAEKEGKGEVFWPLRVALSGKEASPGPVELAVALGKKESIKRIENAISKIKGSEELI